MMSIETHGGGICCGHCGTEVKPGYSVCAACGANYRRRGRGLYIGIVLGLLAFHATVTGEYAAGIICGGAAFLLIRYSRQHDWFRRNA